MANKKAKPAASGQAVPNTNRQKRTVYTIRWDKRLKCWVVLVYNHIIAVPEFWTKAAIVKDQARLCDVLWKTYGVLSELRICNKAGQYQPARTYGNDPSSSPG